LKSGHQRSNSYGMMSRLIRLLFAIVIGTALVGAPAVQAATAIPCATTVTTAPDHTLSAGQAPASAPTPCKAMPGCADMLGCGLSAGLSAHIAALSQERAWTSTVYRAIADAHEGLSVKPDLGPPITI
jgi:hypothetical protein